MPKYMVIFNWKESDMEEFRDCMDDYHETTAGFYESFDDASNAKMNAECGMGAYAEVYVREEIVEDGEPMGKEYRLLYV